MTSNPEIGSKKNPKKELQVKEAVTIMTVTY